MRYPVPDEVEGASCRDLSLRSKSWLDTNLYSASRVCRGVGRGLGLHIWAVRGLNG